jgi:hypothetical protein
MTFLKRHNVAGSDGRASAWVMGVGALGLVFAVMAAGTAGLNALPWCLALSAPGMLVGFLFAVPRVRPEGTKQTPTDADSRESGRHVVNTNLEEISDWVTKTLVGLGLVELKSLPASIHRLAERVATGLTPARGIAGSLALAIVVGAPTLGLLFGYLATRLLIQRDIVQSDLAVSDLEVRVTSMAVRQDVFSTALEVAAPGANPSSLAAPGEMPVDDELRKLAEAYLSVQIEDYGERLAKKNDLVNRMVVHIVKATISRNSLADEAAANQGILIGLAAGATLLHVKYRVVLAIECLFARKMADQSDRSKALALLSAYEAKTDDSLRTAIVAVRRTVEKSA